MPAYSGTAVRLETPGTTSKSIPPRYARRGLVGDGVVQKRIARHETDHPATQWRLA